MSYIPPLDDIVFTLDEVLDLNGIIKLESFAHAPSDSLLDLLGEAGKFVASTIGPLNRVGDTEGARLSESGVLTPTGWKKAYQSLSESGWSSTSLDVEIGGMGLPTMIGGAVQEMLHSSNMAFALCPMLTTAAAKLIAMAGSEAQKEKYLPKLVSGEWTGTMVLTEAQAGSDLAAVRAKAKRNGSDYIISGNKIFITYGDHDLTENIIHIVLARTSAGGVKGLSLFIVPKFRISADGSSGEPNDVRCVSLEHKLGIHGSPTALLAFGENGCCRGELVGEEGRGLDYMFIMMNEARLSVGVQGLGIAERAYQAANTYANERVQGPIVGDEAAASRSIRYHPDVHRMLMTMRSKCEAMRGIAYLASQCLDMSHAGPTAEVRQLHATRLSLLVPIVKAWCTEQACEVASTALQVHGGMGYVEETGAAQHLRDARITPIYEGTTGIQANDLLGRKILRDNGEAAMAIVREMQTLDERLANQAGHEFSVVRAALDGGISSLEAVIDVITSTGRHDAALSAARAVNILHIFGLTLGCWMVARAALRAAELLDKGEGHQLFLQEKIGVAHFYAGQVMPEIHARLAAVIDSSRSALALYPTLG